MAKHIYDSGYGKDSAISPDQINSHHDEDMDDFGKN